MIEQIGNVTLDSKEIIDTAKSAYSKLSFEEQELVSNYNLLEEALDKMEALKEQAEQQEVENALSKLKKEVDKVENITWYHPETYPEYANTRSYMLPYIGVRDRSEWIRLVFHYTGSDWVFFEKITISVDGENYYKTYDYYDVSRDNKSRYVWEWVDIVPDATDLVMLRDIANSQETIVRFEGDNGYKDIVISKADKAAIEDVLDAYSKIKSH